VDAGAVAVATGTDAGSARRVIRRVVRRPGDDDEDIPSNPYGH
jgi:hypothetical protein